MTTESLRAVIWAAVSAKDQAEDDKYSLDTQVSDAQAAAIKHGWTVIDTIRIEGHSRNYRTMAQLVSAAHTNNEPGFDRLVAHFEAKDFDVLICRDANRFARKPSLLYEIVDTILEDCNARIYSLSDGFVSLENADIWLMVKGYEIRKQMNWIKKEMLRGRHKLVDELGIPQGSMYVWSHMKVRDNIGKVIGFVPDPSKTATIEAAARLVINRVSWRHIEERLWADGIGNNGQPFKKYFFYHMFCNPWFWGDAVRNHKNSKYANGQKIGLWCVDHSAPLPDEVVMRRDVNQPALTGELAQQLRAEVIRRITFRPRKHATVHQFSGTLVCEKCGFMMVYSQSGDGLGSYNCQSKYQARSRPGCTRKWSISEKKVRTWMNAALQVMLDHNDAYGLVMPSESAPVDNTANLKADLAALDKQITRLIEKQAAAPDSLLTLYDQQINGLATQRENLLKHIDDETRLAARYNLDDVQSAFRELSTFETLAAFWQSGDGVINQLIHRLLGGRRLSVLDSRITGTVDIR